MYAKRKGACKIMGKMKEYWAEREERWNMMDFECWYAHFKEKKKVKGKKVSKNNK